PAPPRRRSPPRRWTAPTRASASSSPGRRWSWTGSRRSRQSSEALLAHDLGGDRGDVPGEEALVVAAGEDDLLVPLSAVVAVDAELLLVVGGDVELVALVAVEV